MENVAVTEKAVETMMMIESSGLEEISSSDNSLHDVIHF